MNSSIQPNRQLQYLFVALLLAGFGMPAMAKDPTPNHKEILLSKTENGGRRQVLCTDEDVDIRGLVKLKFGMKDFFGTGNRQFGPVDRDLETGWSGKCPNGGECLVGFGKSTRRQYVAKTTLGIPCIKTKELPNGLKLGTCTIFLLVTAKPYPASPRNKVTFKLVYTISYKFDDNKVTSFDVSPKFGEIACGQLTCRVSKCFCD
jgi:hypothetical protein